MKKLFSEIWIRLKSETPSLFKKIRNFGATMTATGTGLAMNGIWKEGGAIAGLGIAISFVASLVTTESTEDLKNKVTNKSKYNEKTPN